MSLLELLKGGIPAPVPKFLLASGGRISGFIYFEQVTDVTRVSFVARLVEVGGQQFGAIQIPFLVE